MSKNTPRKTPRRKFATKQVLSGIRTEYHSWDKWEVGDTVVGKLIGAQPNKLNPAKKDYILEVIEAFFQDNDAEKRLNKPGIKLTLNTAGMLEKGLTDVEFGTLIQVEYTGMSTISGGKYAGKESHTMQISVVEELEDESGDSEDDL